VIVLDTHAWIWFVNSPETLGAAAAQAINQARGDGQRLHVSCISTWELYMLVDKGRLSLAIAPGVWVARCEKLTVLQFEPVNNDIARISVTECAGLHADPADRMIVATALYLGASVVTKDDKIRSSGVVRCIW
jgi:PIN domain nuclease of toxin-antitoxin system